MHISMNQKIILNWEGEITQKCKIEEIEDNQNLPYVI